LKDIHFGVSCDACHVAELVEIPPHWQNLEFAQIHRRLAFGEGLEDPEDNMQGAEAISEFMNEHESHGAVPVITELDEVEDG